MKKILLVVSITGFMFAEGKIGGVTYFDSSAQKKPLDLIFRDNILVMAERFRIR